MAEIGNPQLRGAVDNLITQVTPDNVLGVRRVLLEEVQRLRDVIDANHQPSDYDIAPGGGRGMGQPGVGFTIGRCSDDPISRPAQISFQRKIDAVVAQCRQYVTDLNSAAESLADIARRYDYTEEQIEGSFKSASLQW